MSSNTEEKDNNDHLYEDPLAEPIFSRPFHITGRKHRYRWNHDKLLNGSFHNPLTRKKVSYLYFCDTAGPFGLFYFERGDGEDPYPLMFCQPTEKEEDETTDEESGEIETVHTQFLKQNNIVTIACRRKEKAVDESKLTPSGKLKYYLVYHYQENNRRFLKTMIQNCLQNLATVSFLIVLNNLI